MHKISSILETNFSFIENNFLNNLFIKIPISLTLIAPLFFHQARASEKPKVQTKEDSLFFSEWMALGSGCRAKNTQPGDVMILNHTGPAAKNVTLGNAKPGVSRTLVFQLPHYALEGGALLPLAMAKECAIRVTLKPGARERIVSISAQTQFELSKEKGAEAAAYAELKLGAVSLGHKLFRFNAKDAFVQRKEEVVLFPGRGGSEEMPSLGCGETKILGFDYSFQAQRKTPQEKIHFTLAQEKKLTLTVDTEACSP